jgi:peptidyl-prolyl cis-trans isomerase A (cyclophilin A)
MLQRLPSVWLLSLLLLVPAANGTAVGSTVAPPTGDELPEGWYARIETSMGKIVVRLLPEQAPQAVAQFVALARGTLERVDPVTGEPVTDPYYDGTEVYSVELGVRFEAGKPAGSGGPQMWAPPKEGVGPVNYNLAGRLGLNLVSGRGATPYNFFVTATAQPRLSGVYPCLGVVVEGRDVALRITAVRTQPGGRPVESIRIEKVRVFTVGDPQALPELVSYVAKPRRLAPRPRTD